MNTKPEIQNTSKKPNLLVLTSTFPRYAQDTQPAFVHDLCLHLNSEFNIHVLAPHARGIATQEYQEKLTITRYRYFIERWETLAYNGGINANLKANRLRLLLVPWFLAGQLWATVQLLKNNKFDLVHAHWIFPQGFIATLAMKILRKKCPILVTAHGADLFALNGKFWNKITNYVLHHMHHLTVVSPAMKNDILKKYPAQAKDLTNTVSVLSMGVDLVHTFYPRVEVSRQLNQLIFVGRLVAKKGVKILLSALALLKGLEPSLSLIIIGDGPERQHLEQQTQQLGLQFQVKFLGAKTAQELPQLYSQANIAVMPSIVAQDGDQEGLGLVAIEAMGCGCIPIISALPATKSILSDNLTQCFVTPGDAQELADKILFFIKQQAATEQLRQRVRQQALASYDWSIIAKRYAELCHTLM